MNKRNNNEWDLGSIIVIAIAFSVFWPLGIFLILKKLGLFDSFSSKKADNSFTYSARQSKYKAMVEGRDCESIEYLASAVGVSYESALRELQQMINAGAFGNGVYINYIDKTIVFPNSNGSSAVSQKSTQVSSGNKNSAKSGSKTKKGKVVGKDVYAGVNIALLIVGIILLLIGISSLGDVIDTISWIGTYSGMIKDLLSSAFFIVGGGVSFITMQKLKRRSKRFMKYLTIIENRDCIPLKELASMAGVSNKTLQNDLDVMFSKDMMPAGAYTDMGTGLLILNPSARPIQEEKTATKPEEDNEDRYRKILREIRSLNDAIPGEEISARIDEIEDLTAQIFNAVEKNPEKLPQIKSFMSYYLPTTLKLLRSYAAFEQSGANGENVRSAKEQIEKILDTLVDGFKKQLDKLYETDAMDISSDIDVLENMLRRDGLSGDEFGQAKGGH